MRVNLRPLTYWVIHEKYKVRFKNRTPELVQGVVTSADGTEMDFDYYPESLSIELSDRIVTINDGGWVESTRAKDSTKLSESSNAE